MKHETILEYWRGGSTFLDVFKNKLAHEDEVDDWIDFWHNNIMDGALLNISLKDFLGFKTKQEFSRFLIDGEMPKNV